MIGLSDGQTGEELFAHVRFLQMEQKLDLEMVNEYCETLEQCRTLRDICDFDAWIAENLVELWQFEIQGGVENQPRTAL